MLEGPGGEVLARESATVSASADPTFSFEFPNMLERGMDYRLLYVIDSNFGEEGTAGACDPPANDHQWALAVDNVDDDVMIDETHRPTETASVCEAFTADLTFSGDAGFQGAHGGQTVTVAVFREGPEQKVATASGTVSETADPSFSFDFPGLLLLDEAYRVEYWIDSNFGGGTVGTCDSPDVDHQWSVDLGMVTEDVAFVDEHRPTETESVCGGTGADTGDGGTDTGDGDDGDTGY